MFSKRLFLFVAAMACLVGCQSTRPRPIVHDLTPAQSSEEAFDRLKEGMTKKEFEKILGEPGISDVIGVGAKLPVRTTLKYPKFGVEVGCNLQGRLVTKSVTQTAFFPPPRSAAEQVIETAKHTVPVEPTEAVEPIGPALKPAPDPEGWNAVTDANSSSTKITDTPKPIELPKSTDVSSTIEVPKTQENSTSTEAQKNMAGAKPVAEAKSLDEVGKRVHRGMNGKQVEAALKLKPDVEIIVDGMGRERYYRSLECCLVFDEYDELFKYYRVWASKMPSASGIQELFTLKPANYEDAVSRLKVGMTLEQVTRRLGKPPSLNTLEKGVNTSWWPELDCILFFGPVGLENWSRATPENQPARQ